MPSKLYSALDLGAQNIKRKEGPGQAFLNELMKQPNVKKDELEDRGLTALAAQPKLTKEQMLRELQVHQAPQIQERILKHSEPNEDEIEELANQIYGASQGQGIGNRLSWNDAVQSARESLYERDANDQPQYSEYTLPGGENYREMLLHLPRDRMKSENNFNSSHYGVPNILAHMRLKDRTGPNGEKLLHLEELQSDWHQRGRDHGYKTMTPEEKEKNVDILSGLRAHSYILDPIEQQEMARIKQLLQEESAKAPNGPFKNNWHEMALKHLINHAAQNGYQGIVVTPGEVQNARYPNPERNPKGMTTFYDEKIPSALNKLGKRFGVQVDTKQIPIFNQTLRKGWQKIYQNTYGKNEEEARLLAEQSEPSRYTALHHFPITEEMRKDVTTNGLPMYATGGSVQTAHDFLLHHIGAPEYREQMKHLRYLEELMEHMASGGSAKPAGIQEELDRLKAKMQQETALYNQYIKEHQQTDTKDLPTYESWKQRIPSTGIVKLKEGGQIKKTKKAQNAQEKRILVPAVGAGGVRGIVVPRHMLEGTSGVIQKGSRKGQAFKNLGMNEINAARAAVYGAENRDPLTLGEINRIHRDVLQNHFALPVEQQIAAEKAALNKLRAAKHIGNDADTLDASEKLDTVNHETDDHGRNYVGWASKGVAGHALYTSGHGENEVRHVINTCPGQTTGCGGGVDENGVVDTKRGTCFAPNAESQYVNASVRRAAHEQAKHDPAMTADWILAHTGSLREAARLADRNNKVTLFRPNVVDETDTTSRHVIRGLNKQRVKAGLPMIIANSYGKTNELHDPENGYYVTHSNVGPKVKQGQSIAENIGRDKQRVRSTIMAAEVNGKDFINDDNHLTPPKNSYMVTDVKRGSPLAKAMEKTFTHAKYWDAGTPIDRLKPEQIAEGNEGHFDGSGKPTSPENAHYGHVIVNGKRYDYQKQHILHPRLVQVGTNEDGSPHMIPTDSRFKDDEYLPKNRFMTRNGKQAGAILLTTPTESTSNAGHQTSFTHHVNESHLEHAKNMRGEYEIDNPYLQEAAKGKEYMAPKPIKFLAEGGTVKSIPSPYHDIEDLTEDFKAFPERFAEAQVHLHTRLHEEPKRKHKKHKG